MAQRTAYARERLAAIDGVELLHDAAGRARVRASGWTRPVDAVLRRCAAEGINAGYPLGADYPEYERRPAGRDHRAPHARAHRPAGGRARSAPSRPSATRRAAKAGAGVSGETPMQRDRAVTIFERSRRGPPRRACCPRPACPPRPLEELIPRGTAARRARRGCPRSPSPRSCATTTASRAATSTSTPASTRSARAR